jgi:hypothetical protein
LEKKNREKWLFEPRDKPDANTACTACINWLIEREEDLLTPRDERRRDAEIRLLARMFNNCGSSNATDGSSPP